MKEEYMPTEIISIVCDSKHMALDSETEAMAYWPHAEQAFSFMTLVIRTHGDGVNLASAARNALRELDSQQPIKDVNTMENLLAKSIARSRFNTVLLTIFALVALALATVGIYGVMSYAVTQRTHEIGIRMALGAQGPDVLKLVLRNGMMLALIGVVTGVAGAFALTRLMSTLLFCVPPRGAVSFTGVSPRSFVGAFFSWCIS